MTDNLHGTLCITLPCKDGLLICSDKRLKPGGRYLDYARSLPFCRVFNDDVAVAGLLALMSIF